MDCCNQGHPMKSPDDSPLHSFCKECRFVVKTGCGCGRCEYIRKRGFCSAIEERNYNESKEWEIAHSCRA